MRPSTHQFKSQLNCELVIHLPRSSSYCDGNPGISLPFCCLSIEKGLQSLQRHSISFSMGDSPMHNSRYSRSPSPRRRYSRSPSPHRRYSVSRSPIRRDNGTSLDALNPGNNLYVAGLSVRVKEKDLEDLFSQEGKVIECRLVVDPRTRESRGFGFVTMETLEDAERCIKYLNRSTFEGRIITVEKAKRKRARTPTPGEYLGIRATNRRSRGYRREYDRDVYSSRRSPKYSPYRNSRDRRERSPRYSPYHGAPGYRREHSLSLSPEYSPYRR